MQNENETKEMRTPCNDPPRRNSPNQLWNVTRIEDFTASPGIELRDPIHSILNFQNENNVTQNLIMNCSSHEFHWQKDVESPWSILGGHWNDPTLMENIKMK